MTPRQLAYEAAVKAIGTYRVDFNAPTWQLPDHVREKLAAILSASDPEAAAKKALQTAEMSFLAAWARGRIPGRITATNVEQRVAKALSLADYLDSTGEHERAEGQRRRAENIRRLANEAA